MDSRERDSLLKALQKIADNPELIDSDERAKSLIAKVYKQGRKKQRQAEKKPQKAIAKDLKKHCFLCHQPFVKEHKFYEGICLDCGELNYQKRYQTVDLSGKIALVTGARIRIGYATALKLLRSGAKVIATTRFPHDAARRYAQETDFDLWSDRLYIYGLDLRHLESLDYFTQHIRNYYSRLDIIVNNAAQTIRRPTDYYRHLLEFEALSLAELPNKIQSLLDCNHKFYLQQNQTKLQFKNSFLAISSEQKLLSNRTNEANFTALLSQVKLIPEDWESNDTLFPIDRYNNEGEQLDLRTFNSWLMNDEDINLVELLEVHVINAISPFIINSRLKSLMKKNSELSKYIINVSSVEGRFSEPNKSWRHPHTNMAKAALNQMTRTCAKEYAQYNIWMNAIDPGWISFQQPHFQAEEMKAKGIKLPLDAADGAARIYDLIYLGEAENQYVCGKLFKNYQEVSW